VNNKQAKKPGDPRKEVLDLITEIRNDLIRQPANRTNTDFYPTKSVFLKRGLGEEEHRKWHDRNRHRHMREALLVYYNNLNPDHQLEQIERINTQHERKDIKYPSFTWIDLACYAALIGIKELKTAEQHAQAQNQVNEETKDLGNSNGTRLTEAGEEITLEKMTELIAKKKPDTTLKTHEDTLKRLCRVRKRELQKDNKLPPAPLYKTGHFMRDIYLKRFDNETGQPLFQRMIIS
jgi:hypothetical protein